MYIKKIFNDKLIIIVAVVFIIASLIDIIYASLVQRGLMFDGCIWFPELLSRGEIKHSFYFNLMWNWRARGFIKLINELPINIAILVFHIKSKFLLSVIFSFPLFLNTFLCLIAQYLLTLRSNRIDILLSALCLQAALIIPISMYSIVEINLAAAIMLLLFHYLVADIEPKKYDYVFIFLLTVISYYITEVFVYCGIIMFFISLYYVKKADTKKKKFIKLFIGLNCFLISIFQFYCLSWLLNDYNSSERVLEEYIRIFNYFKTYYFKVDIFLFFLIIFVFFKKSRFKVILFSSILIAAFVFFAYVVYNSEFISACFFQKRYIPYIFLPFVIIINTLYDVFSKHFKSERINNIFYNLFMILFIIGILNISFSLLNSYVFSKSVKEFKVITSKPEFKGKLISPSVDLKDFYNRDVARFLFNCNTYMYDKLIFTDEYKFDTFLTPFEEADTICPQKFYFDAEFLYLPFSELSIKNSYWDLTEIKNIVDKNKTYKEKYKAANFES